MHTARNRQAGKSRPKPRGRQPRPDAAAHEQPDRGGTTREDVAFMLRQLASPPTFPLDLIVPPHRGAVITSSSWPVPLAVPGTPRPSLRHGTRRTAESSAISPSPPRPDSASIPDVRAESECSPALTLSPEPDALSIATAPIEPTAGIVTPQPGVPQFDKPRPEALQSNAPLPATRALVPQRQGFLDVLAFALRDSGRRLARWSSARRRAQDMQDKLDRAEARMRAMEAQLAALQALQERVRQGS